MPLQRRIPKFGFKNPFRTEYEVINVGQLAKFVEEGKLDSTITLDDLRNAGFIRNGELIKLLGDGTIDTKVDIEVHAASASGKEKVEEAGGTVTIDKS